MAEGLGGTDNNTRSMSSADRCTWAVQRLHVSSVEEGAREFKLILLRLLSLSVSALPAHRAKH